MICKNCGTELRERFDMLKLEHEYACPKCKYHSMASSIDEAFPSTFRSMSNVDYAKHAITQQMFVRPEDQIEDVNFDYNPFKKLREELEQNILTYRNDKDALIDILSSTVNVLLRTLEVTYVYRG